jgi:hypothetical protein
MIYDGELTIRIRHWYGIASGLLHIEWFEHCTGVLDEGKHPHSLPVPLEIPTYS